ncbi:hypothetical protein E2C01_101872 [Portunus trituberculatus]|uniref:Uncharacterized protein n=1 Tax=Portunus trituberculatus TaxID=210409 RepID=A0A5B7KH39_PORTR|nr:hypothetical protein [Portunus trituberculatus]
MKSLTNHSNLQNVTTQPTIQTSKYNNTNRTPKPQKYSLLTPQHPPHTHTHHPTRTSRTHPDRHRVKEKWRRLEETCLCVRSRSLSTYTFSYKPFPRLVAIAPITAVAHLPIISCGLAEKWGDCEI